MKYIELCEIVENKEIIDGIYKMIIKTENIAGQSKAGQFIQIKINDLNDPLLRRPISINEILKDDRLCIYYKVVGKGTDLMARLNKGEKLDVIGPLGNGFDVSLGNKKIAIIGGGIGVAPLLETAKVLSENNQVDTYIGFNDDIYLEDEFRKNSKDVYITTVTGKIGEKGYITEVLEKNIKSYDLLISCGPNVMLSEVKKLADKHDIKCQLSLEERMGCGFGACVGCSIETTDGVMKKVCVDGPVFLASEVNI
ncbi:dihydroorotate dehydrogenase electron transfer subunit [Clostridiaceae bacterium M8S5]|nr:dihydroorotate dehydrogenase electron transfer subunit [Clostridiaceae bacterium M8S5]